MIINVGAVPILIDIDFIQVQINDKLIESKITKKTKAIIVVHMHGRPTKMDKIIKIRNKYSLRLLDLPAIEASIMENMLHLVI